MSVDEQIPAPEADSGGESEAGPAEGVFGNLPRSRPGSRSPRRSQGAGSRKPKPARAPAGAEAQRAEASAARTEPPPPAPPAGAERTQPAAGRSEGGLEDIAWAGVAAAAEAATIGVRLATRALEALRGGGSDRS